MSTTQPINQPQSINWPSLLQLVFSGFAALILLGIAVLVAISSVIAWFTQASVGLDLTQSLMITASLAFAGILVLPSAFYAWKSLSSPESEPLVKLESGRFGILLTLLVLVIVPVAIWLGNWVSQNDQLAWFLLPVLNILVNGLSAYWIVYLGIRGLVPNSPRRIWGVFASGLVLSPAIILILELLALVGFGVLVIFWAVQNPGMSSQLQGLIFRLKNSSADPQLILQILLPLLLKPGVLFIGFSFISVIVPIIEETFKPIGVWFVAGKNLAPAQGFAYGVLCGAGFGLFENLGNTSAGGETWALLVSTRITTLLLHCLTTGMVGWALASAWSEKRYLRLASTFAFAVVVHGLWNGMAVLSAVASLEFQAEIKIPANLINFGNYAAIGIIILGVFNLVLYIAFNSFLRKNNSIQGLSARDGTTIVPQVEPSNTSPWVESLVHPTVANEPALATDADPSPLDDHHPSSENDNPPTNTDIHL
jgi:hypothetical protein